MDFDNLRISPAKLLLLVAFSIVLLIEIRTVLGFFGLDVSVVMVIITWGVVIGGILLWALLPTVGGGEK